MSFVVFVVCCLASVVVSRCSKVVGICQTPTSRVAVPKRGDKEEKEEEEEAEEEEEEEEAMTCSHLREFISVALVACWLLGG